MRRYNPKEIEERWQKVWAEKKTFKVDIQKAKKPFYNLMMFPYPSGEGLHVGHVYAFGGADTYGRFKKMQGNDVFEPMGFDSFGIHSENYAIKVKKHPKELIEETTAYFREKQLKRLGALFDWDHEVITSDPSYYKWTQWLFIQLFKAGLAVRKKAPVVWCPSCKTVLADEQVIAGKCERCNSQVVQKELEQWFFKITDYAQRLLDNLDRIDWSETTKTMQKNWIGRSEDTEIDFPIKDLGQKIKIVTTRADNIFGATFVVLAPEHKLTGKLRKSVKNYKEVEHYVAYSKRKTDFERGLLSREKTGIKLDGIVAINPANGKEIPVYVSEFVLITYGTGAIMGVPAHDDRDYEFAKKFSLPIVSVIEKPKNQKTVSVYIDDSDNSKAANDLRSLGKAEEYVTPAIRTFQVEVNKKDQIIQILKESKIGSEEDHKRIAAGDDFDLDTDPVAVSFVRVYMGDGRHVDSVFLNGLYKKEAIENMNKWLAEKGIGSASVHYRLRDWLISRQRYWGPPIPMIYCESCAKEGKSWFTSEEAKKYQLSSINYQEGKKEKILNTKYKILNTEMKGWYPATEKELPVELPELKDYRPQGKDVSPLATLPDFVSVKCPECGKSARRETDVSDTFLDSSWYFLRYPSTLSARSGQVPFDPEITKKWLPVDSYIGGNEHAVLHLLYTRFITMALKDQGLIEFDEPFKKFRAHGLVIHEGAKMSKSRGNVVNPNEFIDSYGADTLRMYLLFLGPYDKGGDFSDRAITGVYRFLTRVWNIVQEVSEKEAKPDKALEKELNKLIKSIGYDLENLKFNTAIASLMEFLNLMYAKKSGIDKSILRRLVLLLSPLAPHISEELWGILGQKFSVHQQDWPQYDPTLIEEEVVTIILQVNGRLRDQLEAHRGISKEEVGRLSLDRPKIKSYTENKKILKSIWIEGRLLNLVVSD